MLFDPFEEELYFPSCLIEVSNDKRRQMHDIGEKKIFLVILRVDISDPSEFTWDQLSLCTRHSNNLIGSSELSIR